ncbi:hypothetical protein [Streptomyces sp. NPDC052107]|uniref:hypothetical protein n=1 Tax=Streptomyces sp. NPDC052107 TaxID=3155632 RepID=UPI0034394853
MSTWQLFDVLAVGDIDWRPRPYAERRTELLRLLEDGPATLRAVPTTEDRGQALKWVGVLAGVEGSTTSLAIAGVVLV